LPGTACGRTRAVRGVVDARAGVLGGEVGGPCLDSSLLGRGADTDDVAGDLLAVVAGASLLVAGGGVAATGGQGESSCSQDCSRSEAVELHVRSRSSFNYVRGFPDTNEKIKGVSDDRFLFRRSEE